MEIGAGKPPPRAPKHPHKITFHNHTRQDNYYWLRDRNNPEVIKYLQAENEYLNQALAHLKPLQDSIFKEMVGRIKQDDQTYPYFMNGFFYYTRFEQDSEYPIFCRKRESLDSPEEILLNVNNMAVQHGYYHINGINVSPDNKLLAFGIDTLGRRLYTICIKNLENGVIHKSQIKNTTGVSVWANDNKTLFYARRDKTLRPNKIFRHNLDSDPKRDKEVYHEKDKIFSVQVAKSKSHKFIYIYSSSTLSSEVRYLSADKPTRPFKIFNQRENDHIYRVFHDASSFYLLSNYKAKNFRLFRTELRRTKRKYWQEIIAHRDDVLIQDVEIIKDHIVLDERAGGLSKFRYIEKSNGKESFIDFDEQSYMVYFLHNSDINNQYIRFAYSSLTTPGSTIDFDLKSKKKIIRKQQNIGGNYNASEYKAERIFAHAEDGTKIPISLVFKKGLKKNGRNPLLLYGYGSYGISMDANFNSIRLSLLDRGFIFAIAHIRGGEEFGTQWYEDGKLFKKMNTFTDYISSAEELIRQAYTKPDKLFAMGGSAGGLLMGAVLNMRPNLWKAVIADVPFFDVLTTMLDENIPLTTSEFDEWGNPKYKRFYDYILSYSPYDNIEEKEYPALLITAGLHDSQVQYWEPAKFVAKMRELKKDENLLLLYTEMESGHSGAAGRFEKYKTTALKYAFILDQAGVSK